jgi:hypothetical protein
MLFFAACTVHSDVPERDLAAMQPTIDIAHVAGTTSFEVSLDADQSASWAGPEPADCTRVHASTTVTVNGTRAEMIEQGDWARHAHDVIDPSECIHPLFDLTLTPPLTLDIAIADGTTTVDAELAIDPKGDYKVVHCDSRCLVNP